MASVMVSEETKEAGGVGVRGVFPRSRQSPDSTSVVTTFDLQLYPHLWWLSLLIRKTELIMTCAVLMETGDRDASGLWWGRRVPAGVRDLALSLAGVSFRY